MENVLTLENIFSNAPDEELFCIVGAIINRLNASKDVTFLDNDDGSYGYDKNRTIIHLSDSDKMKFVQALAKPQ